MPKLTPRIPIYKIRRHAPPLATPAANTNRRRHLHHAPPSTAIISPIITTPPLPSNTTEPPTPPTAVHHLLTVHTTDATTAATATAFPAAAATVAGCGWQFGHHRRGGAYTTSDLMGLSVAKPPLWWRSDDGTATTAAPCGVRLVVVIQFMLAWMGVWHGYLKI
nr:hypothetical protein [Tanacetum cinerariifolium]